MRQLSKKFAAQTTLAGLCLAASAVYKDRPAFSLYSDGKICKNVTYERMGALSGQIGSVLRQLGIQKGGRVLLLAENCPQWPIAYFGIAFAGAVSVPLLTGFSVEQIEYICNHSGVSAICLSRSMAGKFDSIAHLPLFSKLPFIYIDGIAENSHAGGISVSVNNIEKQININSFNNFIDDSSPDDLATIIYTSGTQGSSKGVMLSSRNIISSSLSSLKMVNLLPKDRMLSVLPLAHSYECGLGLVAPVISGASITYLDKPPSPSVLLPAIQLLKPTAMLSVPLLIEKIYKNSIFPKLRANKLYRFPLTRRLAIWFAGRKLLTAFGGKLRFFGIGGAPLSPEVEKFLYYAKFPYSIGYGLTEASPLVAGNSPLRFKLKSGISSADKVMLRISKGAVNTESDEGEIQLLGPNVMMGYYNDIEKTEEVFTSDGWLRTGDLGNFDNKGRLHIRGRLKALILGPSGENIYPEEIEGILGSSALVEESLVYSGKKGELVALVRLSEAAKTAAGVIEQTMEDLRTWVNKKLSAFSKLSRIEIKYEPFEKTPTMKIKRYLYV